MSNINSPVEHCGLAEDKIFLARLVTPLYIFYTTEPYKVNKPRTVEKVRNKPATHTLAHLLETAYLPTKLHKRHIARKFRHLEEAATVDIFIREIVQQVVQGKYLKFPVEQGGALLAHPWKVFYISCCGVQHSIMVFAIIIS